jgi:alanine-synthesizing transaminase
MDLRRVDDLPHYVFDRIAEWRCEAARRGREIVDLGIGSPDLAAPPPVVERACAAWRERESHGYPSPPGEPELRRALADWYADRHGVTLDPETQTLVTWGASEALSHLPWVLAGPGDAVLVPAPCYPIHHFAVLFSGATPVPLPVGTGDDPVAGVEAALETGAVRPRAVLLNFPHNPTTRCVEPADFARLVQLARRHDLVLVNDFAYADIAFDGYRPPSLLAAPGATGVSVELVSLSKSHNMAGFRIGFVAGDAAVIAGLRRLKSYLDYGVSRPTQLAALTALTQLEDFPARMAAEYAARRDRLCDGLTAAGWPVARPLATMFVWAPVPEPFRSPTAGDPSPSLAFAKHLFDHAGVAVSPGIGFGPAGEGFVRFALVRDVDGIDAAVAAIGRALNVSPAG